MYRNRKHIAWLKMTAFTLLLGIWVSQSIFDCSRCMMEKTEVVPVQGVCDGEEAGIEKNYLYHETAFLQPGIFTASPAGAFYTEPSVPAFHPEITTPPPERITA